MSELKTQFDDSSFPIVKINFGNTIKDEELDDFEKFWLKQYLKEEYFYFVLDTTNLKKFPLTYVNKFSDFTKKIRKLEVQYLKSTVLLINNPFVRTIYRLYLKIQTPISKVYIVKNLEEMKTKTSEIINLEDMDKKTSEIINLEEIDKKHQK